MGTSCSGGPRVCREPGGGVQGKCFLAPLKSESRLKLFFRLQSEVLRLAPRSSFPLPTWPLYTRPLFHLNEHPTLGLLLHFPTG